MIKTFEQFLQKIHANQYEGIDDDMPDDYQNWLEKLDQWEIIELAEEYGRELQTKK